MKLINKTTGGVEPCCISGVVDLKNLVLNDLVVYLGEPYTALDGALTRDVLSGSVSSMGKQSDDTWGIWVRDSDNNIHGPLGYEQIRGIW